ASASRGEASQRRPCRGHAQTADSSQRHSQIRNTVGAANSLTPKTVATRSLVRFASCRKALRQIGLRSRGGLADRSCALTLRLSRCFARSGISLRGSDLLLRYLRSVPSVLFLRYLGTGCAFCLYTRT